MTRWATIGQQKLEFRVWPLQVGRCYVLTATPNPELINAVTDVVDREREKQQILEEYLPAFQNVLARKKSLKMQEGETE